MNRGFIAIISTIILSITLLVVVISVNARGYFTRFNILTSEYKEISSAAAEACVAFALKNTAEDEGYNPLSEEVVITPGINPVKCTIISIENEPPGMKTLKISANFQRSVTNLKITARSSDLKITAWEELQNF